MGFRISKRINLGKGIGLNLGKKGISTSMRTKFGSIGTKGFSVKTGVSGVSYNEKWKSSNNNNQTLISKTNNMGNKKNKTTAALLALFLGVFGVHKFYLGKTGWGVVYMLIMTISWFLGVIDSIILFTMSEDNFNEKYNKEYLLYVAETKKLEENIIKAEEEKLKIQQELTNIINSYPEEIRDNILNKKIWLGMKKEHLLLIKGNPDDIETHQTKKTTKEVFIYGKYKTSGDVFTFKNDELTEFKDR